LVAQAFLGEVGEMQVLHRNDNPLDNRLTNLYLGTAADNARDQYANGGRVRLREVPLNVERIEAVGIQDTFDITVTGNHWFAADNLIIHNSYNEISARYCELDEGYYVPNVAQITTQSASNKQMRTKEQHPQAKEIRAAIAKVNEDSYRNYKTLIETGCPRELARSVLPVGAYSRMFATVDLHNLLHFLRLRSHEHAQWEIREYAKALESLVAPVVPYTIAAYRKSLEVAA
jgi:flavin-dependent thymidylate synthase